MTSGRLIGGVVSSTESNDLPLVETYCLRSIITIAIEVISSIKKNTPKSDSIIFIISSSIYFLCLKISSKVSLANS